MGDQAANAMGDAGKGSFQQSQDTGQKGPGAAPAPVSGEDWRDKLKEELSGTGAPKTGKEDAAGPGRGRV